MRVVGPTITVGNDCMARPVTGRFEVTREFDAHPSDESKGIDIFPLSEDAWNVYAAADGTVVETRTGSFRDDTDRQEAGNFVVMRHSPGLRSIKDGTPLSTTYTFYFHLDSVVASLEQGQRISRGTRLGRIGNTGDTIGDTGTHLHFEIREGARYPSGGAILKDPREYVFFGDGKDCPWVN